MKINFITNMPAPYKLACFEIVAQKLDNFFVTFECATDPQRRWETAYHGARLPHKVMATGLRRWVDWLLLGLQRHNFPIYGTYNVAGAVLAIFLNIIFKIHYGIWTSSRLADWRRGSAIDILVKKTIFSRAKVVFVPGSAAKEYVQTFGVNQVFITPNCVDVDAFAADLEKARAVPLEQQADDKLRAIYVGRLSREKDVERILRALDHMGPDARGRLDVRIVGEGQDRESLQTFSETLGLTETISFVGYKGGVELARYYDWADILILPSLSEPWGLVINEAMQAGVVPVVSELVGCVSELIHPDKTGYIFKAENESSLANVLLNLTHNRRPLESLGACGYKLIADFTPKAFADGLISGIKCALHNEEF